MNNGAQNAFRTYLCGLVRAPNVAKSPKSFEAEKYEG
jgi:hypothetical protein